MGVTRRSARSAPTDLVLLQREVNQLFDRLSVFERGDADEAAEWQPSVDVYERESAVIVVVEVPGLPPEALKVVIRDHKLVVAGERRERRPGSGIAGFLCMERPRGRFRRTIPLDPALDTRQARAELGGGLLTITIPRVRDRRGRETVVPVEREQGR